MLWIFYIYGHIRLFEFAKTLGDSLYVAIDSDEKIKREKGQKRPFNTLEDRKEMLLSIKHIDNVVSFSSKEELEEICKLYRPDFRLVGSDWKDKEIVGAQHCKEVIYFDRIGNYSTTRILNG